MSVLVQALPTSSRESGWHKFKIELIDPIRDEKGLKLMTGCSQLSVKDIATSLRLPNFAESSRRDLYIIGEGSIPSWGAKTMPR